MLSFEDSDFTLTLIQTCEFELRSLSAESSSVRFVYVNLGRPSGEPLLPADGRDAV